MCTKRRERRPRLDTLAGGQQAAFGEDVWVEEREGVGDKEQGKVKHRKDKDGKTDLLSEGQDANQRVSESYLLPHSVEQHRLSAGRFFK